MNYISSLPISLRLGIQQSSPVFSLLTFGKLTTVNPFEEWQVELTTVGGVFSILWPSELDGTLEGSITNAVITRIQRQGKEQHYTSEKTIKTLALGRRELYWLHQEAKVGTKKI